MGNISLRDQNLLGSTIERTDVACNVSLALIFDSYTILIPRRFGESIFIAKKTGFSFGRKPGFFLQLTAHGCYAPAYGV